MDKLLTTLQFYNHTICRKYKSPQKVLNFMMFTSRKVVHSEMSQSIRDESDHSNVDCEIYGKIQAWPAQVG